MKLAYLLSIAAASVGCTAGAPIDRRGLLDLDLGLCLGLNLLGLVSIDIDKSGCKPNYSNEQPYPGNQHVCHTIRTYNIEPSDVYVHCADGDAAGADASFRAPTPPGQPNGQRY
ncbi:hypothetical protein GGI25_004372 [Coemansia spiralis]|uniref:Uncharacterized protein n=2 Tax=Coemansia TaxID=4863 RepID=A0A9W8KVL7_9FUNG|nr:hypothetical protein BX070DRAFT_134168 [Coemansia spiralis]KAJ1995325.1 hypothetical protein EDC05_000876 [Coemansia umbellata]KAJ2624848.1 hypothetical protein GGI26_001265 [Coemansia sp. RSA 1358]KAJ2674352.1 hypothetical protein GGI25_004372 [Coemansia spiralis]